MALSSTNDEFRASGVKSRSLSPMNRRLANPGSARTVKDRHFVTALARGLEVLRCFTADEPFLGNQEIAQRAGLPKSTVSRLTHTLTSLGYLRYSESRGKYELGSAMLALGFPQLASTKLRRVARPLMQELADYAQMSVSMGVQDRTHMLYVENCRSVAAVSLSAEVGARIPMATTAMGRAFLCVAPEDERERLLEQIRLEDPAGWHAIKLGIDRSLRDFQRSGFCVSLGEWYKDVHAVAVPLLAPDGSHTAVFSIGGPAYQLRKQVIDDDIGPRLCRLVRELEDALAGAGR